MRNLGLLLLLLVDLRASLACGEDDTRVWHLDTAWEDVAKITNPIHDLSGDPIWYFLRTTRYAGPVASRVWHRDGRYVPLVEHRSRLF